MKRLFVLLIAIVSVACAAVTTVSNYGASGGGNATCNIAANAGRQIVVYGILGTSDKAGSVVTVKKGATTGVTTNYTTLGTLAVGAATVKDYNSVPLLVLPINTQAQFLLDSTTANSLFVTYEYR